ncbi:putative quinol monooxygenase [Larkinella humicola]|uniref:Antibiotic biosynthesis monooxygenase n=1 Tax=Larkinella humicola TaxID=2607654 RepID=A0A5N1J8R9_9BACT|nr:antibiotic biosynthesis monooxygenase [Larkinella humicola]KAA9347862.1 antibiotic biosynthesis monooxygenase [Larkinella humicola]
MDKQKTGLRAKAPKSVISFLVAVFVLVSYHTAFAQQQERMVRISEIEIDPAFLEAYKTILAEESAASVKLEPGVIAIFPMYQKENPTSVRILELYASKTAYEQHLKTAHFLKYKTATLNMVKSLKLVDMGVIDVATMPLLFRKLKEDK